MGRVKLIQNVLYFPVIIRFMYKFVVHPKYHTPPAAVQRFNSFTIANKPLSDHHHTNCRLHYQIAARSS